MEHRVHIVANAKRRNYTACIRITHHPPTLTANRCFHDLSSTCPPLSRFSQVHPFKHTCFYELFFTTFHCLTNIWTITFTFTHNANLFFFIVTGTLPFSV